jgi:hypothetical protein
MQRADSDDELERRESGADLLQSRGTLALAKMPEHEKNQIGAQSLGDRRACVLKRSSCTDDVV